MGKSRNVDKAMNYYSANTNLKNSILFQSQNKKYVDGNLEPPIPKKREPSSRKMNSQNIELQTPVSRNQLLSFQHPLPSTGGSFDHKYYQSAAK
mmetsp:Transcript_14586/g.14208  ORF Transcript_14586/g.14208 Transcript_14586/m.14208 type:complete len:94 (+) Transcript_14586:268-549(+)